ncbi:MAG: YoaK family protein [Bryobacteraceae bacterium]
MNRTAAFLLLTWTAGAVDGLSYLSTHVFTANMTGNTVLLALHAIQGQRQEACRSVAALAAFVAGCLIAAALFPGGAAVTHSARNLARAARLELPLLATFAALFTAGRSSGTHAMGLATIAIGGIALGLQSVAVRRLRVRGVATTFITGTITSLCAGLISTVQNRLSTGTWPEGSVHVAELAAIFLVYLSAAAVTGYTSLHHPLVAAILPLPPIIPVMIER